MDIDLTRTSSAAPSEGAIGCLWKYFNHEKGGNKPARRRLQRLVRSYLGQKLSIFLRAAASIALVALKINCFETMVIDRAAG